MSDTDVAIIGLSGIYPQAETLDEFYMNLSSGLDSVRQIPHDRLTLSGLDPLKSYPVIASLNRIDGFDHKFFNISLNEAQYMDPHQRLLLQLACAAIEDAGYGLRQFRGSKTAVVLSASNSEYYKLFDRFDPTAVTGILPSALAGRISYCLDLRGPAELIDTACSSSLAAIYEAYEKVASGEVDYALAGGINLFFTLNSFGSDSGSTDDNQSSNVGIAAPDGKSKAFDESANGTGWGEGGGIILIKRLSRALLDRDNIYAVIKGGAINQDGGRSNGITAPSPLGQTEAIVRAWEKAGIDPATISYIEAHGTGTRLGDPIEIQAINDAFSRFTDGNGFCSIGSVKTNIGHLIGAAGIAGLTKAALSVKRGKLFQSIHLKTPNPLIDFDNSAVTVQTEFCDWAASPKRAGVSSFGLSGTNVHMVLEEAPRTCASETKDDPSSELITLSAKSASSLDRYISNLRDYLSQTDDRLCDIAYTLNAGRDDYAYRFACVADSKQSLIKQLSDPSTRFRESKHQRLVVFLFSGDLQVDKGLSNSLCERYPAFKKSVDECRAAATSECESFVFQYGMYRLWQSLGLSTDKIIGSGVSNNVVGAITGRLPLGEALNKAKAYQERPLNRTKLKEVVSGLIGKEAPLFLEMGPEGLLSGEIKSLSETLGEQVLIPSFQDSNAASLLDALAELYMNGASVNWVAFYNDRTLRHVSLPTYSFEKISCWISQVAKSSESIQPRQTQPSQPGRYGNLHEDQATEGEKRLARIWGDILKVDRLNLDSDYFSLGGNSLNGTQLITRIRSEFKVEILFEYLYEFPTLTEMARRIDELTSSTDKADSPADQTIASHGVEKNPPLSSCQQRLWFFDRLQPNSPIYNIPIAFRLKGQLSVSVLERSLNEIVRRHDVLRAQFATFEGKPLQWIRPSAELALSIVDLSAAPDSQREHQAMQLASEEAQRPIDISRDLLLRATLLRLGEDEHYALLTMHHIISDYWSIGLLIREIGVLYQSLSAGEKSPLPDLSLQYTDYARWQQEWLLGEGFRSQLDYWKQQLAGCPLALELPADRPRPPVQTFSGARELFDFPRSLLDGLKELGRQEESTLYMTMLAAFQLLLHRYSGQEDILVGSPIANRNRPETESLIGFFANTLVLRTDLSGDPSFRELLRRARQTALGAYARQDMPFEKLVDVLRSDRDTSYHPLIQVMLVLQNIAIESVQPDNLKMSVVEPDTATAKFDLTLSLSESSDGISGRMEYNTDLWDAATIKRMIERFQILLEGVVENPDQQLSSFALLTAREQEQLLVEWSGAGADHSRAECIHKLFELQVERRAQSSAVVFEGQALSYAELNARANKLAHYLRARGVGPEIRVGICMQRSIDMVVAILGVLKAGGAYVPLDPGYPKERLRFILEDAQTPVILTEQQMLERLPELAVEVVALDADWDLINQQGDHNPAHTTTPENAAYIIYTSGSTGKPKGVLVTHLNVTRLFEATQDWYHFDESDTWTLFHSYAFDFSVWEVWGALLVGGKLAIVSYEVSRSPEAFYELLRKEHVTVLNQTPSAFRQLMRVEETINDDQVLSLRLVIFGGEALDFQSLKPWFDRHGDRLPQLVNMYGITETTVHVTFRPVYASDAAAVSGSAIGEPIPDLKLYVLDQKLQPSPIGIAGEICVGGAGLARGYLNRPELTAQRFIPDPFSGVAGARLYRSGDLGRYLSSGDIQYQGRADHQVKIRGFRIETGEIEAALQQHPGIRQSLVIARGDDRLVAYVVPTPDQTALTTGEMRRFLNDFLPQYMVPEAFVVMQALPLTINGKIDLRALPAPETIRPELETTYLSPGNGLQQAIAAIWQEALRLEKVGIEDNFFDLGGNSLLMVEVHGKLRACLGQDIAMIELFRYPTVGSLARYLRQEKKDLPNRRQEEPAGSRAERDNDIAIVGMAGAFPGAKSLDEFWRNLSSGIESISFFSELDPDLEGSNPAISNSPNYVKARGILGDIDMFDAAFFGFNPREAEILDPQHRLFLECAWEALENAGYDPGRYPGPVGLFAGASMNTYWLNLFSNRELLESVGDFQAMIANDKDFLPTRVSYKLNLRGPSINVQTACSTSLVAVHLACRSLLDDECDMALAGGVSIRVPEKTGYLYQEGGIASPDGHCRAFDAQAKGTVAGNGVGIVVLKRLSDALKDGDTIRSVIKGSAINNDGSLKIGYTAPSIEGQAEVISQAIRHARVDPETISYIEAHGTGTALGDPIEVSALTQAFRSSTEANGFCALGSVKTNIGHLDAAAGVAGLIKTVLALEHKEIPPSLHFELPNPQIPFQNTPFYVNASLRNWNNGAAPRRAGVSSFGIGGSNAHVVIEDAPPTAPSEETKNIQLILLSARSAEALEQATANLAAYLKQHKDANLADVAYTLQVGRANFDYRRFVLCRDVPDAVAAHEKLDPRRVLQGMPDQVDRPIVFMFPGQGTQYVNMGQELYQAEPVFRSQVDRCSELLKPHLGMDLRDLLYPAPEFTQTATEQLKQTSITQPVLFVIEYAVAQLWKHWGVQPQAMIGHSIGEYVAACLAGVISLEDALQLVCLRGRIIQNLPGGAMLSIGLGEQEVQALLKPGLSLASINGPDLCVVAGDYEAIAEFENQLSNSGIACRRLITSHAFHSHLMEPALEEFVEQVRKVNLNAPETAYISNVTGTWVRADEATDPQYWAKHLRQTVRYMQGLGEILKQESAILLEVGPGRSLSTLARRHPGKSSRHLICSSLPSPSEPQTDLEAILETAGRIWLAGTRIDWPRLHSQQRRRIPLPTYPFERQRYWVERKARPAGLQPQSSRLGKNADVADWFYLPVWKQAFRSSLNEDRASDRWLVFSDGSRLAGLITERLERDGCEVITATTGAQFARLKQSAFCINPQSQDDYNNLLGKLCAQDMAPQGIIHLWSLAQDGPAAQDARSFDESQHTLLNSLLFLTQALEKQAVNHPVQIEILSNGVQQVTGLEQLQPEKATLLGACNVIPQEYANISCRSIDITMPEPESWREEELVSELVAEFFSHPSDRVVAYRGSQRWAQTFDSIPLAEAPDASTRLRHKGVYMITGGLGKIGLLLAEHLIAGFQARVVLVGRTKLPERDDWPQWLASHDDEICLKIHKLQTLEQMGAEILLLNANVECEDDMREAIARACQHFGDLHGVIHAAGVTGSRALRAVSQTTPDDCVCQMQPKAHGLLALEKALQGRDLDFCLLFSSLSSVLGGLGFFAYASANAYMDAFVRRHNQNERLQWVSINWDGWRRAEESAHGQAAGSSMLELAIEPEEGIEAFRRLLSARGLTQVVVSTGNLHERIRRWVKRDQQANDKRGELLAALHPRPSLQTPYVPPGNELETEVAAVWQELLGIAEIGMYDNFFELGGHSLLATQLVSRLRENFQVELSLQSFFESPTLADISLLILQGQAEQLDGDELRKLLAGIQELREDELQNTIEVEKNLIPELINE